MKTKLKIKQMEKHFCEKEKVCKKLYIEKKVKHKIK